VLVVGGSVGTVRENVLNRFDTNKTTPVVLANTCGVTTSGNVAWYNTAWAGPPATAACP
jgi:hypothetical protein